jgi:hypothetical protein
VKRRDLPRRGILGIAALEAPLLVHGESAAGFEDSDEPSLPPPECATVLFDGHDLSAWTAPDNVAPKWKVQNGYVEVVAKTGNMSTRRLFRNFQLHVEFWVPYRPNEEDEERGNSGIYLQGKYEIQILDSYGRQPNKTACGSLYTFAAPLRNACKKAEKWQSFDIAFAAPHYDQAGKLMDKARVTVFQNRIMVQKNVEVPGMTGSAATNPANDPHKPGPIMLQDHLDPVRFRNIWMIPDDDREV